MSNIVWDYVKKLEFNTAIEDFEKSNDVSIPSDLKECIIKNNGGRPDKKLFDTKKSKRCIMGALLSFNKTDLDCIYSFYPVFQEENKNLMPFAIDPGGNFLCMLNGNIVFWLHETGEVEYVANSFTEFLNKLYI